MGLDRQREGAILQYGDQGDWRVDCRQMWGNSSIRLDEACFSGLQA